MESEKEQKRSHSPTHSPVARDDSRERAPSPKRRNEASPPPAPATGATPPHDDGSISFTSTAPQQPATERQSRASRAMPSREAADGGHRSRSTHRHSHHHSNHRHHRSGSRSDSKSSSSDGSSSSSGREDSRSRSRRRHSSRRRSHSRSGHRSNGETIMTYKEFMKTLPDSVTPAEAQVEYDKYVSKHSKQLKKDFDDHKQEGWFLERYHPAQIKRRWDDNKKLAAAKAKEFVDRIGLWDVPLDIDEYAADTNNATTPQTSDETAVAKKSLPMEDVTHLVVKGVNKGLMKRDLVDVVSKIEGFKSMRISEPEIIAGGGTGYRTVWISLTDESLTTKGKKRLLLESSLQSPCFEVTVTTPTTTAPGTTTPPQTAAKVKYAPVAAHGEERLIGDLERLQQLIRLMNKEKGFSNAGDKEGKKAAGASEEIVNDAVFFANVASSGFPIKKQVDLYIDYLRVVHNYCYYCAEEFMDHLEMISKCGVLHLRAHNPSASSSSTTTPPMPSVMEDTQSYEWEREIDMKNDARLKKKLAIVELTGQEKIEAAAEHFNKKHVKHDAKAGIYLCTVCEKKFKSEEYVLMHYNNKHGEDAELEKVKKEVIEKQFFKNFVNDPHRLKPSLLPAPAPVHHHASSSYSSSYSLASSSSWRGGRYSTGPYRGRSFGRGGGGGGERPYRIPRGTDVELPPLPALDDVGKGGEAGVFSGRDVREIRSYGRQQEGQQQQQQPRQMSALEIYKAQLLAAAASSTTPTATVTAAPVEVQAPAVPPAPAAPQTTEAQPQ